MASDTEQKANLPPPPSGQPSGDGMAAAQQEHGKTLTLQPIAAGFDLAGVRCGVESRLHEMVWKDEDLLGRLKNRAKEAEESRVPERLKLITNGYRVDEAITPKLFRLGVMLTKVLRLPLPLDFFVRCDNEPNACCLPSHKGNRLVMCVHSGLAASLSSQELLFTMGHEAGHALLKHLDTPGISFDDPDFSPMEVSRLRALGRAQEVSCDRFGLLACQDIRAASSALFKIASGLTEKWICFDESAYARHFDELSSMAELVDLEDAGRTHPIDPLRVKALIAFGKSEAYARAFGKTGSAITAADMEKGVEAMLSVLDPDLSELEGDKEEDAANAFITNGALMLIAADGVVEPEKVAWLKAHTSVDRSREELAQWMSDPNFHEHMAEEMKASAFVLRNKLSEFKRAQLLHVICDLAVCGGGLPDAEAGALEQIRQLLKVRADIAHEVLEDSEKEHTGAAAATDGAARSVSGKRRKSTARNKKG
jgi:uncharacterized tellurite resistance protein B-like protein